MMNIRFIRLTTIILGFSLPLTISCANTMDDNISKLYHSLSRKPTHSIEERLNKISEQFLQVPYELNPLGEGESSHYDAYPKYRTDAFDCETYIDTVLAISFSSDLNEFKQCIDKVRYRSGHVSFITRNHFMSLDWLPNNQQQGFITDITTRVVDEMKNPVAQQATALINKPNWYQHLSESRIRIKNLSKEEQLRRLNELKKEGAQLAKAQTAMIPYIPLTSLFNEAGEPNHFLFNQIPNGTMMSIVRPNWDLTETIGTHLNVSHVGFLFWKNKVLMFRQASSVEHKVVNTPLIEYLKNTLTSPTIKGINIQSINNIQTRD